MKKRLLSAALALAMVLTMLPLSVLPVSAADPTPDQTIGSQQLSVSGVTVRYVKKDGPLLSATTIDGTKYEAVKAAADGWYVTGVNKDISGSDARSIYYVGNGVVAASSSTAGGQWYSSIGDAVAAKKTAVVLAGTDTSALNLNSGVISSLTIDLNGNQFNGSITVPKEYTDTTTRANTFNTLTIKDTSADKYPGHGKDSGWNNQSSFSIDVGSNGSEKAAATTITLTNVSTSGSISANTTVANNVTLTASKCGDITLNSTAALGTVTLSGSEAGKIEMAGVSGGTVNIGNNSAANNTGKAASISIKTSGTTTGGKVTAYNAEINGVTLHGVGVNLTANSSSVGAVKVFGHDGTGLTDSQKGSLSTPTVILNKSEATSIGQDAGETLTKAYTVNLNTDAKGGAIELDKAVITVDGSETGTITLKAGTLNVKGSAAALASTGTLTLGAGAKTNLNVTGTNVTLGTITIGQYGVDATVPAGNSNVIGEIKNGGKFSNRGISGGVWGSAVPAENLTNGVRYQVYRGDVATGEKEHVYYTNAQFQQLIDEYAKYHTDTNNFAITIAQDAEVSKAGSSVTPAYITFKNGNEVLTQIKYASPSLSIPLPTTVNGGSILKWTEYEAAGTTENVNSVVSEPTTSYSTPVAENGAYPDRVLNAQVSENTITKLTSVGSNTMGVTARLNGNVITLSGALPSSVAQIEVKVLTDGKNAEPTPVMVSFDNGSVRFANQNTALAGGMSISNDYTTLIINNGTATYTLNGSGLKVQAEKLPAGQVIGYTGDVPVIVTVNTNGTGWTTASKAALADTMSNDNWTDNTTFNASAGSKVSFADSPAVKEALNAIVAGITDSQINSWIQAAQNAAWRKAGNTGTPDQTQRESTGYNKVYVVAYMAVNVTNYNTSNKPGTITMSLTPSYYVEVRRDAGVTDSKTKLDSTVASEQRVLRPRSGSLGNLTGEAGKITLVLVQDSNFTTANAVAHQDSTYAYPNNWNPDDTGAVTANLVNSQVIIASLNQIQPRAAGSSLTFNITHTVGNGLGSFVVNGDAPMVALYEDEASAKAATGLMNTAKYYDTLQAAVDDTEKDNEYINVDANYKGSTQVTMSGKSRTITVNTNGAPQVTSSNATGTVVTETGSGNVFELQLKNDVTTPTGTTATISTQNASNGTARTNVSSAKAGDRVTITTTAYNGYQALPPTVRTNTGAAVSVASAGSTSTTSAQWTFTVPNGATSITITPSFTQSIIPFTDVRSDAWYYNGVAYCYNTTAPSGDKLMLGYDTASSIFGPARTVTRAEVAVILYRLGNGRVETPTVNFTDIGGHNLYNYIVWCANHGYIRGFGDGTFRPNDPVTREQLAQMLYNFAGTKVNYNLASNYTDGSSVKDWYADAMSWAAYYNILSGTDSVSMSGRLYNTSDALRSQVAVTLMKFHQRYFR